MDSDSDVENLLEKELAEESEDENQPSSKSQDPDNQDNSDSGSDYDFNQEDIDELADKDPEFHKWLNKQNYLEGEDEEHPMLAKEKAEAETGFDSDEMPELENEGEDEAEADSDLDSEAEDDEDDMDEEAAAEAEMEGHSKSKITEKALMVIIKKLAKGNIYAFKQLTCMLVAAVEFLSNDDEMLKRMQKSKKNSQNNKHKKKDGQDDHFNKAGSKVKSMNDLMYEKLGQKHAKFYEITEADDFNSVLLVVLNHSYNGLAKILDLENLKSETQANSNRIDITTFKNYKKVKGALSVFIECYSELIKRLVDSKSRVLLLRSLHKLSIFLLPFPKPSKVILQRLIILWAHYPKNNDSIKDENSDSNKLRILSFLIINKICFYKVKMAEFCVKEMYKHYQKQIKKTSIHNMPIIDFLSRTLSEMFLNEGLVTSGLTYRTIFLFIRNLALTLRKAIHTQKHEGIYNWIFFHSIKLFANIINKNDTNEQLNQLIYPLTEIAIGAIKLEDKNIKNIPYRLHMAHILIEIMKHKHVFIPMHTILWPVIALTDRTVDDSLSKDTIRGIIKRNKTQNKASALNISEMETTFDCILKFNDVQLASGNNCLNLAKLLSNKFYTAYIAYLKCQITKTDIAFVENFHPILKIFNKYLKNTKIEHYKHDIKILRQIIQEHSDYINDKRKYVKFNVNDVKLAEHWLDHDFDLPIDHLEEIESAVGNLKPGSNSHNLPSDEEGDFVISENEVDSEDKTQTENRSKSRLKPKKMPKKSMFDGDSIKKEGQKMDQKSRNKKREKIRNKKKNKNKNLHQPQKFSSKSVKNPDSVGKLSAAGFFD